MRRETDDERFLLDTHLLIEGAFSPEKLSRKATKVLDRDPNLFTFSVVSLWEITIKRGLDRPGFQYDPQLLRTRLLQQGFQELEVTAAHVLRVASLPAVHHDPFDRLLLSQAIVENLILATSDGLLARYSGPVLFL